MTDQTADTPVRRPSRLINAIKSIGLLRESIVGTVGAGICVFWIVVALLAPVLAPYPPNQQIAPMLFVTPGSEIPPGTMIAIAGGEMVEATGSYILGGDNLGRDVLSRVIWGARTVLIFAPLATFCAYVAGILMGLAAVVEAVTVYREPVGGFQRQAHAALDALFQAGGEAGRADGGFRCAVARAERGS